MSWCGDSGNDTFVCLFSFMIAVCVVRFTNIKMVIADFSDFYLSICVYFFIVMMPLLDLITAH